MYKKGVIDRIEDGRIAVIISEDGSEKFNLSVSFLPKDAKEGYWLRLEICGNEIIGIEIDKEETDIRKENIREKFRKLKKTNLII